MFPWVKLSAQLLGGLGVSKIVTDVIKHHVTVVTTYDAIRVWAGSLVFTTIAIEQATAQVGRMADEVTEFIEKRKNEDTIEDPDDKNTTTMY